MSYKGSKITINVKKQSKNIDALTERVKNPEPILKKIGSKMVAATNKSFNEHKDPDGNKWQKLAKTTKERRTTENGRKSNNMLFDTGDLRKSLKKFSINKKKKVHRQYEVLLKPELNGKDMQYAEKQNNYTFPHAKNPLSKPRKFMKQTNTVQAMYRKMVKNFLLGGKY